MKLTEALGIMLKLIMIFIVAIFLFSLYRVLEIDPSVEKYCKEKYGEEYKMEIIKGFGNYCVELDYEKIERKNVEKINWDELKEYCKVPKFLELSKWSSERC